MKLTLTKDDAEKLVDNDNHAVLQALQAAGWSRADGEKIGTDKDILVAKLKELGIKHHHALGVDKLQKLIDEAE